MVDDQLRTALHYAVAYAQMAAFEALLEAGADLDIRAGCPNGIERIEAGQLPKRRFPVQAGFERRPYNCPPMIRYSTRANRSPFSSGKV